jgi:hypothetical protein
VPTIQDKSKAVLAMVGPARSAPLPTLRITPATRWSLNRNKQLAAF